jgi:hypothetical protein
MFYLYHSAVQTAAAAVKVVAAAAARHLVHNRVIVN